MKNTCFKCQILIQQELSPITVETCLHIQIQIPILLLQKFPSIYSTYSIFHRNSPHGARMNSIIFYPTEADGICLPILVQCLFQFLTQIPFHRIV